MAYGGLKARPLQLTMYLFLFERNGQKESPASFSGVPGRVPSKGAIG